MIVGISGLSSSGKDTVADLLVSKRGAVKVALADEIKRAAARFFAFTPEQLWGPSEKRNAPDPRYLREHTWSDRQHGVSRCWCCGAFSDRVREYQSCALTPRYALQLLGTEYGRHCYNDVWVEATVRVASDLFNSVDGMMQPTYDRVRGLFRSSAAAPVHTVVVPDVRFRNEVDGLRKAGSKLVRVRRVGYEKPRFDHPSETEQMGIPDSEFDFVLENDGTLEQLAAGVDYMWKDLSK